MSGPVAAAGVKDQARVFLEDAGFEVWDETLWRLAVVSINGSTYEMFAQTPSGATHSCEGNTSDRLAERLANMPMSVQRHFGVRKSDVERRARSPTREMHGLASPKHSSVFKHELKETEGDLPYHASFQGSDGVHACLGTKGSADYPEEPKGFNMPSWSAPNESQGRKMYDHKFNDNMVGHGVSDTKDMRGGRKHFEHSSALSSSEIGTAPTSEKPAGRRYIGVADHVKADLEANLKPLPGVRNPSPARASNAGRDAAWSQFADSLSAGGYPPQYRRGRSPGRVS